MKGEPRGNMAASLRQRLNADDAPFLDAAYFNAGILRPIMCAARDRRPLGGKWRAGGPWHGLEDGRGSDPSKGGEPKP